jgi:hypothetical protein
MAMGALCHLPLSTSAWRIFLKLALDLAYHKPPLGLHYIDDTFVVWPYGPKQLQNFLSHLNSLRPAMQFTMEIVRQCESFLGCSGHQE